MRGTPDVVGHRAGAAGIIPAYAGNTVRPRSSRSSPQDHPRVCGEHRRRRLCFGLPLGSSPRMRGTPRVRGQYTRNLGIIPAYAGNTRPAWKAGRSPRDHPRVCGEHTWLTHWRTQSPGSSPRMRGTHCGRTQRDHAGRIIPAYAGNTSARPWYANTPGDHPRVCGEHTKRLA